MAKSEQDFAFEDEPGLVRQLRYTLDGLAILDVSSEVTVVNWTSDVAPDSFFSLVDDLTDLHETEADVYFASNDMKEPMAIKDVRGVPHDIMDSCQFMRIDLNESRSVAWELIGLDGVRKPMVGYGDNTSLVAGGDIGFAEKLLYATASRVVDPHEIFTSMTALARQYGYGTATAGNGLSI